MKSLNVPGVAEGVLILRRKNEAELEEGLKSNVDQRDRILLSTCFHIFEPTPPTITFTPISIPQFGSALSTPFQPATDHNRTVSPMDDMPGRAQPCGARQMLVSAMTDNRSHMVLNVLFSSRTNANSEGTSSRSVATFHMTRC